MLSNVEIARQNMIENQVRPWEVLDPRVLDVLGAVRREDFVPARYRNLAFADMALPIGHGETMMKPTVEGRCCRRSISMSTTACSRSAPVRVSSPRALRVSPARSPASSCTPISPTRRARASPLPARRTCASKSPTRCTVFDATIATTRSSSPARCIHCRMHSARAVAPHGTAVRDRRRIAGDAGDAVHARRRLALARGKPVRNRSCAISPMQSRRAVSRCERDATNLSNLPRMKPMMRTRCLPLALMLALGAPWRTPTI